MASLPQSIRSLGVKTVSIIHAQGTDDERTVETEAHIQPRTGFFAVDTPIYEGDIVEINDPRGGTTRRVAAEVEVYDIGPVDMHHTEITWATGSLSTRATVRDRRAARAVETMALATSTAARSTLGNDSAPTSERIRANRRCSADSGAVRSLLKEGAFTSITRCRQTHSRSERDSEDSPANRKAKAASSSFVWPA